MPIRSDRRFKSRVTFDIATIVENFPADLKAKTLAKLDICARESGAPTIFSLQTKVEELRLALMCYLQLPKFKQAFMDRFCDHKSDL